MKPNRREILIGSATLPLFATGAVAATADELWPQWQAEWRRMEALATARKWDVTPLKIARPAGPRRLRAIERQAGVPFPWQLRELMLRFSAKVTFGWYVPIHLMPEGKQGLPTASSLRDAIWDIDYITQHAIPGFQMWRRNLRTNRVGESPNRPEMWEHQFPLSEAKNGDLITIDVSNRDGPQPVRYFSHELEGLHYTALAPDFFTFVSVLSKLGWAGTEQDSWGPFLLPGDGDKRYLSTETRGARNWFGWLARDPAHPPTDEPPMAIAAETPAERALLTEAEAGSIDGVRVALAAGARPNVVWRGNDRRRSKQWDYEFATALTYAIQRDDLVMARLLVSQGASLNLRRLAVNEAVARGGLETLRWTIEQGGRVKGWRYDRYHPIHTLLALRIDEEERMRGWETSDRERGRPWTAEDWARWKPIDQPTALAMLDLLIEAGADIDAPWDNGNTMLMFTKSIPVTERLLATRARVDVRDSWGQTVMHAAQSPAKARILVAAGADINAISTPRPGDETFAACTPLQYQLVGSRGLSEMIETFLELGADPTIRDGKGRSTLVWCYGVPAFERMRGFGLDPLERGPDGGTLLHAHAHRRSQPRDPVHRVLLDHVLGLGVGINDVDDEGKTTLHVLAEAEELMTPEDVAVLVERGAGKEIRDKQGRRAFDLADAANTALREALR